MQVEEHLKAGQVEQALLVAEDRVRKEPANSEYRICLFQILAVLGQWKRSLTQLNVAAELDAGNLLLAHMYRPAILCEMLRSEVFAAQKTPLVFGEPQPWVSWMIQSMHYCAKENYKAARRLREKAFEEAPAIQGTINGQTFSWIADGDSRIGPIAEAIIDGKYFWVPFSNIQSIHIEAPSDLRDAVWLGASFRWTNSGDSYGFILTRYADSHLQPDALIQLARKTEWIEKPEQTYLGIGQRMFITDTGETSLLESREIVCQA